MDIFGAQFGNSGKDLLQHKLKKNLKNAVLLASKKDVRCTSPFLLKVKQGNVTVSHMIH